MNLELKNKSISLFHLPALGLLPLKQTRGGTQEALQAHQPHPPHVPVGSHQPHHGHLGQLRQGESPGRAQSCPELPRSGPEQPPDPLLPLSPELLGGAVPGEADDLSRAAAEVENHRHQTPGALQSAG